MRRGDILSLSALVAWDRMSPKHPQMSERERQQVAPARSFSLALFDLWRKIVRRCQRLVQKKSNIETLFISVYVFKSKINAAKKQWLLACKEKKKKSNKKGEKRKLQKTPLGFFSTFQSYLETKTNFAYHFTQDYIKTQNNTLIKQIWKRSFCVATPNREKKKARKHAWGIRALAGR